MKQRQLCDSASVVAEAATKIVHFLYLIKKIYVITFYI